MIITSNKLSTTTFFFVVECAAGYKMVTISNVNKCVKCPIGEYQPATKQKTCISCAGTTTVNEGSTAKEDCISK